jgi:hypothetical protein
MPWISLPQGRSLLLLQGTHRDAEEGFAVRFFTYPLAKEHRRILNPVPTLETGTHKSMV